MLCYVMLCTVGNQRVRQTGEVDQSLLRFTGYAARAATTDQTSGRDRL